MTTYILMTTENEADDIAEARKSFVFRDERYNFRIGDEISFQVIKAGRKVFHDIERMRFLVSYVTDRAPLESGYKAVGFRRAI